MGSYSCVPHAPWQIYLHLLWKVRRGQLAWVLLLMMLKAVGLGGEGLTGASDALSSAARRPLL